MYASSECHKAVDHYVSVAYAEGAFHSEIQVQG